MEKSTFSPLYQVFRAKLVELRRSARLTQRELAGRLRRERSFVARIEQGERRVDVVEFYWICGACGQSPLAAAVDLLRMFARADRGARRTMAGWGKVADSGGVRPATLPSRDRRPRTPPPR